MSSPIRRRLAVILASSLCYTSIAARNDLTLWYAQPTEKWTEALPIGNGHMGAMVFGGTAVERIQFNEDTLWRGKPHDYVRAGAGDQLAEIRRLIMEGKSDVAGKLPSQIDGNFGATAGVAEMLLQSHRTEGRAEKGEVRVIDLLPALPEAWPNGSVKGLCARGGFEVDIKWNSGALTQATIRSKLDEPCTVRCGKQIAEISTRKGGEYSFDGQLKPIDR